MEEFLVAVKIYFSAGDWSTLDQEERLKYAKQYYIYNACTDLGIEVVPPDFMNKLTIDLDKSSNNTQTYIFPCSFCAAPYAFDHERENHEFVCKKRFAFMSEDDMKKYVCKECQYNTDSLPTFKIHQRSHKKEKPYSCDICQKAFSIKSHVQRHKRSIHLDVSKKYKCPSCNYETHQSCNLTRHIKTHVNLQSYICVHCTKGFSTKTNLDRHLFSHNGQVKPFRCKDCPKSYLQQSDLDSHVNNIHLKLKNLSCDQCSYVSSDKSTLRRHMKIHLPEKPYKCDHCVYKCCQKGQLLNHIKKKHKL